MYDIGLEKQSPIMRAPGPCTHWRSWVLGSVKAVCTADAQFRYAPQNKNSQSRNATPVPMSRSDLVAEEDCILAKLLLNLGIEHADLSTTNSVP